MESTIEFLDNMKVAIQLTYERFCSNKPEGDMNEYISDKEFQELRLIIVKLAEKHNLDMPSLLKNCRTVKELCEELFLLDPFEPHKANVKDLINPFTNYLEENMFEVKILKIDSQIPKDLSYTSILSDVENCEKRLLEKDYPGAITSARSLIEGVSKEILLLCEVEVKGKNPSLPSLFSQVRQVLNLDPGNEKLDKPLKEMIAGLISTVNGLNDIRNKVGDGHAGNRKLNLHHSLLAVNSAKTVANFLFHTYEYQKEKGLLKVGENNNA